jgi:hypothetical protein
MVNREPRQPDPAPAATRNTASVKLNLKGKAAYGNGGRFFMR